MKKTALILAVLLFAAMPVTAAFAAAASTRAVMVFGEPVAVESEKPAAEQRQRASKINFFIARLSLFPGAKLKRP